MEIHTVKRNVHLKYVRNHFLNSHMTMYTGEKIVKREVRENHFLLKGYFNKHMTIYTREKKNNVKYMKNRFVKKGSFTFI
jgi:hypothetical protein